MGKRLLEIKDLFVEYSTMEGKVYAVNGVDISLDEGETLGLVGETYAGKQLLRLVLWDFFQNILVKLQTEKYFWMV